jgi:hypothetical protein
MGMNSSKIPQGISLHLPVETLEGLRSSEFKEKGPNISILLK